MNKTLALPILLLALSAGGCASHQAAKVADGAATATAATAATATPPACPVDDPDTKLKIVDVDGGVAIEMTTAGDVAALRAKFAARQAFMAAHPKPSPIKTTKHVEEIPGGLRRVVIADDAADVAKLRAAVRHKLMTGHPDKFAADDEDTEAGPACPIEDKSNKVELVDVDGGIALIVTTEGDAAALRAKMAARMAYKKAHSKGSAPIATEVTMEDVPGGFKRTIIAKDPADVAKLRAHLRAHITKERAE